MILIDGVEYGQAQEIAARLGPDVTTEMVRAWGRRGQLDRRKLDDGTVWYRLDHAATAERNARTSGRGRPRRTLNTPPRRNP